MIHGATTGGAKHVAGRRSRRATIAASHAQAGTARTSASAPAQPRDGPNGQGRPRAERRADALARPSSPTSAARRATSREHGVAHRAPPAASSSAAAYRSATPLEPVLARGERRAASPIVAARRSSASSSSDAASVSTSRSSAGTFSADAVGKLREPADVRDDERLGRARARGSRSPDVSPIVGARRLTATSQAAISDQRRASSTYSCRSTAVAQPEPRRAGASRSKRGRLGPTSSEPRARVASRGGARTPRAAAGCACSRSGSRSSRPADRRPRRPARRPARARRDAGSARSARRSRAARARVLDVARVDDQAVSRARSSTSPASGKSSGRVSQSGGTQLSRHAVREQPARRRRRRAPSRRGSRRVLARDRQPGDEVVEHEARAGRRRPGVRRSASTIQPCASGSLPTW